MAGDGRYIMRRWYGWLARHVKMVVCERPYEHNVHTIIIINQSINQSINI